MPGLFGCLNCTRELEETLVSRFGEVWGSIERVQVPRGVLGGHAHAPHRVVHARNGGGWIAADGEESFLRLANDEDAGPARPLCQEGTDGPRLAIPHCGNLIRYEPDRRVCHLVTDWTGAIPLYYHVTRDGGLLFSSLLRPLARAIGAGMDPVGVAEYMMSDWTLAGRTMFRDIRRMEPGQVLRFAFDGERPRILETSPLGIEGGPAPGDTDAAHLEALWETWVRAVSSRLVPDGKVGVMMSAGWDSRLILGGLQACGGLQRAVAYTHGDPGSRELALVARITSSVGIQSRIRALETGPFTPEFLAEAFAKTEQTMFPHWASAAIQLREEGVRSIWSGMYAEVLSGVYTPGHHQEGLTKLMTCIRDLADGFGEPPTSGLDDMRQFLKERFARRPRAIGRDFWEEVLRHRDEVEHDMAATLERLTRRGVPADSRFSEAFMIELRATQYLVAQALACRAWTDVGLPFGDPDLRALASRVRITRRFRNRLHRGMLLRHGRPLLRYPTAGTIPPASAPIVAQELSRWGRVAIDVWKWRRYLSSKGRAARPRHTWYDYEFLRADSALATLVADLRSEIWDREGLEAYLRQEREFTSRRQVYPDTILKPYGVDLMMR